ncbi:MAG: EutN/CcmL family microcompartment protein [Anaerolineales bacterium]|jgi:ethanolamine utilization protein EutN
MKIAKVVGVAVSTEKAPRLENSKLLLVQETDPAGKTSGTIYIAQDMVGAGQGELVFLVEGSTARVASGDRENPVDAAIVGILDSLTVNEKTTYQKYG